MIFQVITCEARMVVLAIGTVTSLPIADCGKASGEILALPNL